MKGLVPTLTIVVFVALAAAAPWLVGDGGVALLFEVLLMLAMAQLWNLLAGYAGLVSMGMQCFVGLGGYTTIFAANSLELSRTGCYRLRRSYADWSLLSAPFSSFACATRISRSAPGYSPRWLPCLFSFRQSSGT